MKAAKDVKLDDNGNPILKNGKEEKENVTVTRVSPLKNSVIVSVGSTRTAENWSSMARQEGDSVPYSKEEYSAIMKGMFSLDISQVGTFATYNKTGYKNLTLKLKEEALEGGAIEIDDLYVKDNKGNPQKLIRLSNEIRLKRIDETMKALKSISGGAMQTNNMTDVTPKFIVLASMTTGNHPFSHIAANEGINNEKVYLNIDGMKEVLKDYKEQFQGTVFIGKRSGFMDDYNTELKALENLGDTYPKVKIGSINESIDSYCIELKAQFLK
jgi:CRISPR-associated protein Cst2